MGYASSEGKAWAIKLMLEHTGYNSLDMHKQQIESFLDLGAGAGSWLEAVKPWFLDSTWIAMEVWPQYIEQYSLNDRYDLVIQADIRDTNFPVVDIIFLGDVLEHMTKEEALDVWNRARNDARVGVFASTPIIHYEQGHVHGNPYQEHVVADWDVEKFKAHFPGITIHTEGKVCGCFFAPGLAPALETFEVIKAGS